MYLHQLMDRISVLLHVTVLLVDMVSSVFQLYEWASCCPFCKTWLVCSILSSVIEWLHSFTWYYWLDIQGLRPGLWWWWWNSGSPDPAMSGQSLLLLIAGLWISAQLGWKEVLTLGLSAWAYCTILLTAADCSHTGKSSVEKRYILRCYYENHTKKDILLIV